MILPKYMKYVGYGPVGQPNTGIRTVRRSHPIEEYRHYDQVWYDSTKAEYEARKAEEQSEDPE